MSDEGDLRDELQAQARKVLRKEAGRPSDYPSPRPLPVALLASCGWLGLEVSEEQGGTGASFAEVAVILKELGRAGAAGPYTGSAVLAVGLLRALEPAPVRDRILEDIAAGRSEVAVAVPGDRDPATAGHAAFELGDGGDAAVCGEATFVIDAPAAHTLLLPARDTGGGWSVVVARAGAPGLHITDQPVIDATRRFATVGVEGLTADAGAVLTFGDATAAERALAGVVDRGALAAACDSLGLAEAMLDATIAHVAARRQFGRPVGSFQAVKHACADMLVSVQLSRQLVAAAVDALAAGDPEAGTAVSMAKSSVTGRTVEVVGKAMQLHGGIGYTWEGGVHAYLKRAVLNRSLFGSPAAHRRWLARRYS